MRGPPFLLLVAVTSLDPVTPPGKFFGPAPVRLLGISPSVLRLRGVLSELSGGGIRLTTGFGWLAALARGGLVGGALFSCRPHYVYRMHERNGVRVSV